MRHKVKGGVVEALHKYGAYVAAALLVLYSVSHYLSDLDAPFMGAHLGGNPSMFGVFIQNYLVHGYLESKFAARYGFQPDDRCPKDYNFHHPPTAPVLISLFAQAFGNREWVIRAFALSAHLIGVLLICLVSRMVYGRAVSLSVTLIYSYMPVVRIYSALPDYYGPLAQIFPLLILYLVFRYESTGRRAYKAAFFTAYLLSVLVDWLGILNGILILAYYLAYRRKQPAELYQGLLFVVLIPAAVYVLLFLQTLLVLGKFAVDDILNQARLRADVPMSYLVSGQFFDTIDKGFGTATLCLFAMGLLAVPRIRDRKLLTMLAGLASSNLIYLLVFKEALYIHWYVFLAFAPLIALTVGSLLQSFDKKIILALILAVLLLESEAMMGRYLRNELTAPYLETTDAQKAPYLMAQTFLRNYSGRFGPNDSMVFIRDGGWFVTEYYLAREGYCVAHRYDWGNSSRISEYKNLVYIDMDEKYRFTITNLTMP